MKRNFTIVQAIIWLYFLLGSSSPLYSSNSATLAVSANYRTFLINQPSGEEPPPGFSLDGPGIYLFSQGRAIPLVQSAISDSISSLPVRRPETISSSPVLFIWSDTISPNVSLISFVGGIGVQLGSPPSGLMGYSVSPLVITAVSPGYPAALAGVQVGDIIQTIDGVQPSEDLEHIMSLLRGPVGTPVHVTFLRGTHRLNFDFNREPVGTEEIATTYEFWDNNSVIISPSESLFPGPYCLQANGYWCFEVVSSLNPTGFTEPDLSVVPLPNVTFRGGFIERNTFGTVDNVARAYLDPEISDAWTFYAFAGMIVSFGAESPDLPTIRLYDPNYNQVELQTDNFWGTHATTSTAGIYTLVVMSDGVGRQYGVRMSQYGPFPTEVPTSTPRPTTTPRPTRLPAQHTPTPVATPQCTSSGQVEIVLIVNPGNINAEGVDIRNNGAVTDLTGWTIRNSEGDSYLFSQQRVFTGGQLTVYTRAGMDTPSAKYWGRDSALWTSGEIATLTDNNGNVQSTCVTPPGETSISDTPLPINANDSATLVVSTDRIQEGVDILAYCDNRAFGAPPPSDLAAGSTVDVFWNWFAATRAQVEAHLNAATYTVTLDGETLDYEHFQGDIAQENGMYVVYWSIRSEPLQAGEHLITYHVTWSERISDGFDSYGPTTNNPEESGSCTFATY